MHTHDAKILQIQNGGRPPFWKSSFGYISTNDYPINAKFCTIKQNHVLTQVIWPRYQIWKIQHGGWLPFWKWFYRYISAGNRPISMKFGVPTQILLTVTWQSIKICKFKMADDRHIENCYLAISQRLIVRLTRNFVWRRIPLRHRSRNQNTKFRKFKMAEGRHFENGFIATSWPRIIRIRLKLICRCKFWFQEWSRDKNKNVANIIRNTPSRTMQNAKRCHFWFMSKT